MTTHYSDKLRDYLVESITNEGYSDTPLKSYQEKISFVAKTFNAEYGYNVNRVGHQQACEDWIRGLPSVLDIVCYDFDICNLAIEWGCMFSDAPDARREKVADKYWKIMGLKLSLLIQKEERNARIIQ